jgi:hypothetical protein
MGDEAKQTWAALSRSANAPELARFECPHPGGRGTARRKGEEPGERVARIRRAWSGFAAAVNT